MTTGAIEDVIERFFAAIEAGDRPAIEAFYADDVEVWHSATGRTVDKATGLAILDWLMAPGVKLGYEQLELLISGDRVSRRHVLSVDVPGHPTLVIPVSIWLTIVDGRVRRIDEYVDAKLTDELIAIVPRREA